MSLKPIPKMAGVGVTGAAAVVLVWLLAQFGIDMPGEVAAAVAVVLAWVAGWLVPERTLPRGSGENRAADE